MKPRYFVHLDSYTQQLKVFHGTRPGNVVKFKNALGIEFRQPDLGYKTRAEAKIFKTRAIAAVKLGGRIETQF